MDSVSLVKFVLILCAIWDPRRTETAFVLQKKLSGVDLNVFRDNIGINAVVSTFAFRLPLCQLAAIANPATRHEIISILDIETLSETSTCYSSLFPALSSLLETDLTTVNKIYVDYSDKIDDKFILGSQTFGLTVSKIGFGYRQDAVSYVNREFSSKTYMRIQDILESEDINLYSSILLVNGIHYKPTWEMPFTSSFTKSKSFRSGQKTIDMEMMQAVSQCAFLDDPQGFKAISVHLTQSGTFMTFILPHRNSSIVNLLDTMSRTPNFLNNIDKKMKWKFVSVAIPKFKIKTSLDWTPYLKQIGLKLTTDMQNTGLNAILKDGENATSNMYVSKAKQKVFVEIDEGPKPNVHAGFAAMPIVQPEILRYLPDSPPVQLEDFTVDGPFFFSIAIGMPPIRGIENRVFRLLSGVYYGPSVST